MGPFWDGVAFLTASALTLIFRLLNPLFTALINFILNKAAESGVELPRLTIEFPEPVPGDTVAASPLSNFAPFQPICTGLLVLGAILIIALTFGRLWRARQQLGHAETRPVARERDSLADRARKGLGSLISQIGFLNRWYTAASIRRIYAQMIATAGRRGYPRSISETPLEFLSTLVDAWPDLELDMRAVTDAYIRVHYGELPETQTELEAIRAAWKRVQSAAR